MLHWLSNFKYLEIGYFKSLKRSDIVEAYRNSEFRVSKVHTYGEVEGLRFWGVGKSELRSTGILKNSGSW